MFNFIEKLQSKPEAVKRSIMWIGVSFVMILIFTFWLLTFPSQIPATKNDEATANLKKELPGVWQSLKGQINDLENLWQR